MAPRSRFGGRLRAWRPPAVDLRAAAPGALLTAVWLLAFLLGDSGVLWLLAPLAALAGGAYRTRAAFGLTLAALAAAVGFPPAEAGAPPVLIALPALWLSALVARGVREQADTRVAATARLAYTDPLTGAGNRRLLNERLAYEIARHGRHRRPLSVVVMDLDGFKRVNDRFGHAAGDEVLRDVAAALKATVRDQDTVVRQGGDEFCVLAPETARGDADRLAARLEEAVARGVVGLEGVSASVGFAVYPTDGLDAVALLEHADEAAAEAKRARPGRGRRAVARAA